MFQLIAEEFVTLKLSVQGYSVKMDNTTVPVSKVDVEIPLQFNQLKVRLYTICGGTLL